MASRRIAVRIGMIALGALVAALAAAPPQPRAEGRAPTAGAPMEQALLDGVRSLIQQRRFVEAEARARKLLPGFEKQHGPDSLAVADLLDLLVLIQFKSAASVRPVGVMEMARRAVRIRERVPGPDDEALAVSVGQLAYLVHFEGFYEEALTLRLHELEIERRSHGDDHMHVAKVLNSVAGLSVDMNDYAGARAYFEQALAIIENHADEPSQRVTGVRFNLASLLQMMGDYAAARSIYESIQRERAGIDNPAQKGGGLGSLGNLLRKMGDYDAARPLLQRSIELLTQAHGPESHHVASALAGLAALYEDTGEPEKARPLYEDALAIKTKVFGPGHPRVAEIRRALARNLLLTGDLSHAATLIEQARAALEQAQGAEGISLAETHLVQAGVHWAARRFDRAIRSALRAGSVSRRWFQDNVEALSEREALQYEVVRVTGFDTAFSSVLATADAGEKAEPTSLVWDELIRSRAVVLDEMAQRFRAAEEAPSATVQTLVKELSAARNRLSRLSSSSSPETDLSSYLQSVRRAEMEKERIERRLSAESEEFRREQGQRQVGLKDVTNALPRGSALVAFYQYGQLARRPGDPALPSYAALLLGPGGAGPRMLPLGPAEGIDDVVQAWRREAGSDPRSISVEVADSRYRLAGQRLRRAIWDPISEQLADAGQVFIVPDGQLSFVNLATLPLDDGRYLVEFGPSLHTLSAERDLLKGNAPRSAAGGLLALGNPDFDSPPSAETADGIVEAPPLGSPPVSPAPVPHALRSAEATCGALRSMRFEAIRASGQEVDDVESLWRGTSRGGAPDAGRMLKLTGASASETALKDAAPGYRLLHLATHGFFALQECASTLSVARAERLPSSRIDDVAPGPMTDSPLLLSGLALAGANHRARIHPGSDADDGILTAEEIASLDLSSVEWAVLSACDTGVGRVVSREGVLGLRRSFELAGARTLIMSLWKIEDDATRAWMRSLYEGRFAGLTTVEAVRRASLRMIEEQRRRGGTTHPFFWGAFIAAGDWR